MSRMHGETVDAYIERVLDTGYQQGIDKLNKFEQQLFFLNDLLLSSDKDGIDSFLNIYGLEALLSAAQAAYEVGAHTLATVLHRLAKSPSAESLLDRANDLVTARTGIDPDLITHWVEGSS
ncbi:MAG: hypothetical protein AAF750_18550 [Planctomycetota bacterium]